MPQFNTVPSSTSILLGFFGWTLMVSSVPAASALPAQSTTQGKTVKNVLMPSTFRATGNEPGWTLQVSEDNTLTLVTENDAKTTTVRSSSMEPLPDGRSYTGSAEGRTVTVTVRDRICRDTMTGLPRPNSVDVTLDATRLTGCGGEPAELLHGGTWAVQSIAGTPVVEKSRVTLSFGADGVVSGSSSCNSYRGPYKISGEGLTVGETAGTLMACLPEVMDQEAAFLGMLRDLRHFDVRPDGALELRAADGRTIVATR